MQLPVLVFIRSVQRFHSLLLKAQVILFASIGFYSSVQPLFYHDILLVFFCKLLSAFTFSNSSGNSRPASNNGKK